MSAITFNRSLLVAFSALATLTLAAAPAFAEPSTMERVEIRGRVVEATSRQDVHAACPSIDEQLQGALAQTWRDEGRYGEVKVQLVMDNGRVDSVKTQGISNMVARKVRIAVNRLDCAAQASAGPAIYRFSVDFIDPSAEPISGATRTAARSLRING